ncbi:MAG: SbcC/MukB-like Walker B domain-containing protein, partial [Cyanobacteria bacterium P01_E01_bin.48]
ASIVERALPELEAEANRILGQLTHNQLHLHFVTQRSGRRQGTTIDTLDILIADPRGSRPYETYSGGEAFRINFAIRLALSRFMTQRAGTRLQTLLIDEGFGTQDATGRELLVSAINAVANDFACLLAITHLPTLRDRFPSRIQVERSAAGSTLQVLA